MVSIKLYLPPLITRHQTSACGRHSLDQNSSSPQEGLFERVEVSEPVGTPNRHNALNPARKVVEGSNRFNTQKWEFLCNATVSGQDLA